MPSSPQRTGKGGITIEASPAAATEDDDQGTAYGYKEKSMLSAKADDSIEDLEAALRDETSKLQSKLISAGGKQPDGGGLERKLSEKKNHRTE